MNVFLYRLKDELKAIKDNLKNKASIVMTPADIHVQAFGIANECHICGGQLLRDKVRDHCHITGKYRGAAHNAYNLKLGIYPQK